MLWEHYEELKETLSDLRRENSTHQAKLSEIQGVRESRDREIRDLKNKLEEYSDRIRELETEVKNVEVKLTAQINATAAAMQGGMKEVEEKLQRKIEDAADKSAASIESLKESVNRGKGFFMALGIGFTLLNLFFAAVGALATVFVVLKG